MTKQPKPTMKELTDELNMMVKKGYLKKTQRGYIDSDRVTAMLKEGKTRKQITRILEQEHKNLKTKRTDWSL